MIRVLVAFFGVMLAAGCADNPAVRSRYQAEKLLFTAERALREAQIKPELTGPEQAEEVQRLFGAVLDVSYAALDSLPSNSDTTARAELELLTFRATTRLTQFLYARGRFDSCVTLLHRAGGTLRLDARSRMTLAYNLSRAFQASGQWDSSRVIADRAIREFYPPLYPEGDVSFQIFNLPLHQFEVAVAVSDTAAIKGYHYEAEQYYLELEREANNRTLVEASRANLARLYDQSGQYPEAIQMLSLMTDTNGRLPMNARLRIADITAANLRQYDLALLRYDSLARSLEGRDTLARPLLLYKQAVVLLNQRKFAECRQMLIQLENQYQPWYRSYAPAQNAKARSFLAEGNWERAESEYRFLIENYPSSPEAMQALLALAREYADRGLTRESDNWYNRAERHFQEQAARSSGTPDEIRPLMFMAELYRQKENWKAAVSTLTQIFQRFPRTDGGRESAILAATVMRERLADSAGATGLLEQLRRTLTEVDATPGKADLSPE